MKSYSRSARWRIKPHETTLHSPAGRRAHDRPGSFYIPVLVGSRRPMAEAVSLEFLQGRVQLWFYFLPVIWILLMVELYDARRARRRRDTLTGISIAALISAALYLVVFFITPEDLPRRGSLSSSLQ